MDSKTLIAQVREAQAERWQNSDLWKQSEDLLGQIADHLEQCPACREAFDAQAYPERTLIEFEGRLGTTTIADWICEIPTIDLSSLDYDDPLALLEPSGDRGEGARDILLILEWEQGRITAETRDPQIDGTPEIRWHGRETAYLLPSLVDAEALRGWVEEEVLPLVRPLFAAYERQWDGDNWVGAFPGHEAEKDDLDAWMDDAEPPLLQGESAGLWPVEEWLVDPPEGLTAETSDEALAPLAEEIIADARREQIVLAGNVVQYLEEVREDLREAAPPSPDRYEIEGYETLEKRATAYGTGAHVCVPRGWIGSRVKIVRRDP